MFHDNPTTTKIIPAWSLNHSLETQVPSFKNPPNSRDVLLKTLFLTELACGNKGEELTAITREGLSFTRNHAIFPTKSNYLHKNQKLTRPPPTKEFNGLPCNPVQCPVGALRAYLIKKILRTKIIAVIYSTTHIQASPS